MKKILLTVLMVGFVSLAHGQGPVGKWKIVSYVVELGGEKVDTHAALVKTRPCAAGIVYEFTEDGKASLNAAGCDEKYRKIQERMWAKTKWKLEGDKLLTSNTPDFDFVTTYQVAFSGDKMTWKSEGGVIVYQKL